jgi:hypothetical protein
MAMLRIRITLMRIRIQLVTLMRILIRILASKCGLKIIKSAQIALIPYILACHLQIDADPDPAYHFDADPESGPSLSL